MNPIVRRRSFYFVSSAMTYLVVMGRYMLTRDWTAFEILPLFMPVWIVSAVLASEVDERYAFLRTLAKAARRLRPSSTVGQWVDASGRFMIWFKSGPAGDVTTMLIDGATVFTR